MSYRATSVAEARAIQEEGRAGIIFEPPEGFSPRVVAGADVAFDKARNLAFAAVVIIELETLVTLDEATAVEPIAFPYVPGYLSFRELPALTAAWKKLREPPDVAVFDAHGYAHPRRFGLACHAGVEFGVPSVGCAKSILYGEPGPLGEARGATAALTDRKNGEELGWVLRTKNRVRPVYLSVGHLIDLSTARELILRLTPDGRYRFPETTRRADRRAEALKRV